MLAGLFTVPDIFLTIFSIQFMSLSPSLPNKTCIFSQTETTQNKYLCVYSLSIYIYPLFSECFHLYINGWSRSFMLMQGTRPLRAWQGGGNEECPVQQHRGPCGWARKTTPSGIFKTGVGSALLWAKQSRSQIARGSRTTRRPPLINYRCFLTLFFLK